jgi:hypothetical protein
MHTASRRWFLPLFLLACAVPRADRPRQGLVAWCAAARRAWRAMMRCLAYAPAAANAFGTGNLPDNSRNKSSSPSSP